MIQLEVLEGQAAGVKVASAADLVRVGRSDGNDLVLTDWHVSGEHASIVISGDDYVLRDHHSTNGTRISRGESAEIDLANEQGREAVLRTGDVIMLGDDERPVKIVVSIDEDPDDARILSIRRVNELDQVEAEIGADHEILSKLYEAQKAIGATIELDPLVDVAAEQVFRFLSRATHVTVALREEDDSRRSPRYVPIGTRVRGGAGHEPVPITRSVFKKVVAERAAVLAADAREEVGDTASIMAAKIQSTIGVPLWQGEDIVGVLQVDNRDKSGIFRERDLDVLALLAQSASQAFVHARLYQRLRIAEESQRTENDYLKRREETRRQGAIIGEATSMKKLFDQLRKVVNTRVTVLIDGETGTGKELIASAVHYWSDRRERLFVAQNCAAMPENLLESELFGHKKGSFTGATEDKKGLFELADAGTLFLDEVGEMPLNLQAKLLRALQEGEIRPVGHSRTIKVDTRIVAATNRDLETEVSEGRFREDLYYRLKVFPLRVPPLRERQDDIALLAAHFLRKYSQEFGRAVEGFSQQAAEMLRAYKWPGNVRELENEVQRLVIQVDDEGFVQPDHLSPKIRQAESLVGKVTPTKGTLKEMMEQVEKWVLREALTEHGNNKSQTARTLGITREGLHKKLKGYGMS